MSWYSVKQIDQIKRYDAFDQWLTGIGTTCWGFGQIGLFEIISFKQEYLKWYNWVRPNEQTNENM